MSGWSPSYNDCDNIISDIYALTHTARMRRRAELGLDKLRISEQIKDESLSPKCLPRPTITSIQNRPLPTPGHHTNRQSEHIYQSPIRTMYNRRGQESPLTGERGERGQYQYGLMGVNQAQFSNIPTAKYHPQNSRIPLAVSQQSISHKSQVQSSSSRLLPQHGQAHLRHNGHCQDQAQGKDRRLSSHVPALGGRAVTELDFSRHRPVNNSGVQHMNRAPSVTDNSEHSSSASVQPGPSLLGSDSCIRKGVMWVQQEKLFSRWKERFIILTSSYLHIFKKSTSRLSDMGTFVNKIRLSEIENLNIEERKGYLTLVLVTARDSKLLLRKTEGIRDWQRSIEQQLARERQRHREMQSTNDFWNRKQFSDCQNSSQASQWLLVRDNIGHKYGYLSRMSPNNFHSETEDSGFESLVTVTSDSSSNSSRMVSPHPPQPRASNPPPPMIRFL